MPINKRKRVEIDLATKISILDQLKNGVSRSTITNQYNIGKSTLSEMVKNETRLRELYDGGSVNHHGKRAREGQIPSLDRAVLDWFCQARSQHVPITEEILKAKTKALLQNACSILDARRPLTQKDASMYDAMKNFTASNGWIEGFRKRYSIRSFKVSGESGSVNLADVDECRNLVKNRLATYELENIYNCDETALFWKCIPDRTLSQSNVQVQGRKQPKDRVTVLLCSNATGSDKRKPLVIGRAANPRCFKNVDKQALGIHYRANKTAWMTGAYFTEWLQEFDRSMNGRKIALILDGASSHCKDLELNNIEMIFLKANTTSICQPMDQGIIQNVKTKYRKQVLWRIIEAYDSDSEFQLNLKEAIDLMVMAWSDVAQRTISACFKKAGILPEFSNQDDLNQQELVVATELDVMPALPQGWNDDLDEWFDFDLYYNTEANSPDEATLVSALLEEVGEDESEEEREVPSIPLTDGVELMDKMLLYLEQHFRALDLNHETLIRFKRMGSVIQRKVKREEQKRLKQSTIDSFFKN